MSNMDYLELLNMEEYPSTPDPRLHPRRMNTNILIEAQSVFTTRDQPAFSPPQFHVNIDFSGNTLFSDLVIYQDSTGPEFVSRVLGHLPETSICFNLEEFLCYGKTREIISERIKDWPSCNEDRRKLLAKFSLRTAREAVISMPASHNVVHIQFRVVVIHENIFDERDEINRAAQNSMDAYEAPMLPAADSSIESLETKKIVDSGNCSICLEDFSGCEVVCMPCSHPFHADCIKKWLRTSHYCPICRFEMPTS